MWKKEFQKYFGLFMVGAILIVVYKTFDSFDKIWDWINWFNAVLSPLVIGTFIAYILSIPCRKIEQLLIKTNIDFLREHRRGIAVAVIYLLFIAVIALAIVTLLPAMLTSLREFMEQLPSLIHGFVSWFNSLGFYIIDQTSIQKLLQSDLFSLDILLGNFSFDNVNRYAKGVIDFGSSLFDIFICLILSVYLLLDRSNLKKSSLRILNAFVPEKHYRVLAHYGNKINEFITLYISCQLVDAIIVFLLSLIALATMRVNYASLLALLVGAFNLIPYFGAIVATILAGLITFFTKSFTAALIVVAILIVIQQLDANFIQPKLLSGTLNIHPVWVIVGVILGGAMFGVLGIFLAVPVFALLRIIILDILEHRESKLKTE